MMTYIPICLQALFVKVEWKPIEHKVAISVDEMNNEVFASVKKWAEAF